MSTIRMSRPGGYQTVCMQIMEQIRKRFSVLEFTWIGIDRDPTFQLEGVP